MAKFSFNLADVNGNNGFNIDGGVFFTFSNRTDFNGDGTEDLIVFSSPAGSESFEDLYTFYNKQAYFVYGKDSAGFPANLNLANINGTNGIQITNENDEDAFILLGGVVDLNGDDISDLYLKFATNNVSGIDSLDDISTENYIIFGDRSLPATIDVSDLDGKNGFSFSSDNFDVSGLPVGYRDINNDGIEDLFLTSTPLINSDLSDLTELKPSPNYVIFGREEGFSANIDVDTLDGTDGFKIIDSSATGTFVLPSISSLEDINGDEIDEIIVTQRGGLSSTSHHIIFGSENFAPTIDLASLDGNEGLTITESTTSNTITASDAFVSYYDDLNGDDIKEIFIQESITEVTQSGNTSQEQVTENFYFIYGGNNLPANIDLSTLTLEEDEGFNFSFSLDSLADKEEITIEEFDFSDINGDGFIDVILTEDSGEELKDIYVVFGDKEGFESNIDLTNLDGSNGFVLKNSNGSLLSYANVNFDGDIFDFNGDGINDLVVDGFDTDSDTTYILFGLEDDFPATIDLLNPNTNALAISRPDTETAGIIEVLDINDDGFDDLAFLVAEDLDDPARSSTIVFGSDRFSQEDNNNSNASVSNVADFNDDKNTDLVWRNSSSGQTIIWLMEEETKDERVVLEPAPDSNWELQAIADFNDDDNADLVWRNKTTGDNTIWYMDGTEKSDRATLDPVVDLDFEIKGAGDFDGDGNADLIWRNKTTGRTIIWYMEDGDIRDRASLAESPDSNWDLEGVGDFNRDGYDDLVWRNGKTGQTSIWYMEEETKIDSEPLVDVPDLNWTLEGVSDFNGDDNPDLLWRNHDTGSNRVWYMEGATKNDSVSLDSVTDSNYRAII
ncbi:MAG: hypothetical protein Tsb0014_11340 [Pleurocapsa sp.]